MSNYIQVDNGLIANCFAYLEINAMETGKRNVGSVQLNCTAQNDTSFWKWYA